MQVSATADAKFVDMFWAFTPTSLDRSVYAGAALQITIQIPANTKAGITAQISHKESATCQTCRAQTSQRLLATRAGVEQSSNKHQCKK